MGQLSEYALNWMAYVDRSARVISSSFKGVEQSASKSRRVMREGEHAAGSGVSVTADGMKVWL